MTKKNMARKAMVTIGSMTTTMMMITMDLGARYETHNEKRERYTLYKARSY